MLALVMLTTATRIRPSILSSNALETGQGAAALDDEGLLRRRRRLGKPLRPPLTLQLGQEAAGVSTRPCFGSQLECAVVEGPPDSEAPLILGCCISAEQSAPSPSAFPCNVVKSAPSRRLPRIPSGLRFAVWRVRKTTIPPVAPSPSLHPSTLPPDWPTRVIILTCPLSPVQRIAVTRHLTIRHCNLLSAHPTWQRSSNGSWLVAARAARRDQHAQFWSFKTLSQRDPRALHA